jgi:RNA polymerase sigma-70 factor, ECF subfamily
MALFRRPQAEDAAVEVPSRSSILGAGRDASKAARKGLPASEAPGHNGAAGNGAASGEIFADREVLERERRREQRLVEAACRGEESAIEALYRTHFDTVYRYVLLRLGSAAAAEDVTSQVFLGMVRGLGRYRDEGKPFVAWLYAMARKQVAFYQRGQSRAPTAVDLEAVEDMVAKTAGPHATVEEQELRVAISRALAKVPEGQREVILLRYVLSMSVADTASVVGRTEGAVKQLQLRGLATLKSLLAPQGLRLD